MENNFVILEAKGPVKHLSNMLQIDAHQVKVSSLSDGYVLYFKTKDDCVATALFDDDCYTFRIMVRGTFISCFAANIVDGDDLQKPTYNAIEQISEETGNFAIDFLNGIKDNGSIYAESIRNSLIEQFGFTEPHMEEHILAVDMRVVKYLHKCGLNTYQDFLSLSN